MSDATSMSRACSGCGADFVPNRRAASRQKFCTAKCAKQASYRASVKPSTVGSSSSCQKCGAGYVVKHGLQRYCSMPCKRAAARDKVPQRWRHFSSRYGLSRAQIEKMLADQDNCCAICDRKLLGKGLEKDSPQVDHDHFSGEVRKILCRSCNTALGAFGDNPETLRRALHYLELWSTQGGRAM